MPHALGFDGGGTKTECVLVNAGGEVISRSLSGPSNPLRIGFDRAYAALANAAAATLAAARLKPSDISAVCAGLSGAGRPGVAERMEAFFRESFPNSFVRVTTDLETTLEAVAGAGAGVVLIAGTGSAACGRNAAGETARVGGYGPWIGDEGSAFEIGRRAVAIVGRFRDHGAPETALAGKILPAAACASWDELIERVATNPDDVFPRVFPQVVELAADGDAVARRLLLEAASELGEMASALIRRLKLQDAEFPLAKSGGVFGHSSLLDAHLDERIRAVAPRARIAMLDVPPAVGAAQLALRLAAERNPPG